MCVLNIFFLLLGSKFVTVSAVYIFTNVFPTTSIACDTL